MTFIGSAIDSKVRRRGSCQQLLPSCWQQVVVIEFGKRHDTTDTMDFCPRYLFTDLLRGNCNCCNGFWPLLR